MGRFLGCGRYVAIGLATLAFMGGCMSSSSEEEAPKEVVSEEDTAKEGAAPGATDEGLSNFNEDPLAPKDSGPLALQEAAPLAPAPVPEQLPKEAAPEEKQRESLSGGDFGAAGLAAAPGLPEMGSKMVYIVKKGDTLGKISKKIFGQRKKWKHLANWNNLADVNRIYPGEVIYYQLAKDTIAFASKAEKEEEQIKVIVQQGQTLGDVAAEFYGSSAYWPLVWRQNAAIKHPDKLIAGSEIFLTSDQKIVSKKEHVKIENKSVEGNSEKSANQFSLGKNVKQEKVALVKVILENV